MNAVYIITETRTYESINKEMKTETVIRGVAKSFESAKSWIEDHNYSNSEVIINGKYTITTKSTMKDCDVIIVRQAKIADFI